MAEKFGSSFAWDMLDRGRRELGGVLYPDSNVAQPSYPLRSGIGPPKESPSEDPEESRSTLDERVERAGRDDPGRDDPGRDGPEMDR